MLIVALGEEVTRAFREFKASCDTLKDNTEYFIKYSQVIKKMHFDQAEQDKKRKNSALLNSWIINDIFMQQRKRHPELGPGRPFFFLLHNPVVCGLMQCAALLQSQAGGIKKLNKSLYAVSAAHLYNAARNEGDLATRWSDMENLIDLYGRGDIFLGAPPKTVSAYRHHHRMARGGSATNFARDHKGGYKHSVQNARFLKVPELMETFEKFLCQTDATRTDLNVDLMEKFLHQTAHSQGVQKDGSSHKLNPVQLLTLLEQCMEKEEAKLVFNYWTLHHSCWTLLFEIYRELKDEFTAWLDPETRGGNPNLLLHGLPHYIFDTLGKESGKKRAGKENILSRVGRVMDKFISQKAQNQSLTTVGVVNDEGLETETEHGTQNGECIHWGKCDRPKGGVQD